jgi:hypothetical protein
MGRLKATQTSDQSYKEHMLAPPQMKTSCFKYERIKMPKRGGELGFSKK